MPGPWPGSFLDDKDLGAWENNKHLVPDPSPLMGIESGQLSQSSHRGSPNQGDLDYLGRSTPETHQLRSESIVLNRHGSLQSIITFDAPVIQSYFVYTIQFYSVYMYIYIPVVCSYFLSGK